MWSALNLIWDRVDLLFPEPYRSKYDSRSRSSTAHVNTSSAQIYSSAWFSRVRHNHSFMLILTARIVVAYLHATFSKRCPGYYCKKKLTFRSHLCRTWALYRKADTLISPTRDIGFLEKSWPLIFFPAGNGFYEGKLTFDHDLCRTLVIFVRQGVLLRQCWNIKYFSIIL